MFTNWRLGAFATAVAALALIAFATSWSVASAGHGTPTYKCNTSPYQYGFSRWHYGLWNFCATDSYGPPEWIYWNYLPGTPGHNNPGVGPYYSLIAQGVSDWAAAQPNWKYTYKSDGWASDTDAFFWQENLDYIGAGVKGQTQLYYCTSQTTCSVRGPASGYWGTFNLVYMILDTTGVHQGVVSHEMGHGLGLVHPANGDCFVNPNVMVVGCLNYPSSDDATSVNNIYPDP